MSDYKTLECLVKTIVDSMKAVGLIVLYHIGFRNCAFSSLQNSALLSANFAVSRANTSLQIIALLWADNCQSSFVTVCDVQLCCGSVIVVIGQLLLLLYML